MTDLAEENRLLEAMCDVLMLDCERKDRRILELECALLTEQRNGENLARDLNQAHRNQRREWNRIGFMADQIDLLNDEILALTRELRQAENLNAAFQAIGRAS